MLALYAGFIYTSQLVASSGHCYAFDRTKTLKTWAQASSFCIANGAKLATIASAGEYTAVAGKSDVAG